MKNDPEQMLAALIQAFKDHYEVACKVEDDENDELSEAEERLQDAFFSYDNALFSSYGVELPFDIYDEEEDDEDEDFEDEEEDFDDEFEVYELDDEDDEDD